MKILISCPGQSMKLRDDMRRVGSCFDNVVSETFNSVQYFRTRPGPRARIKIGTWIADFYNTRRLHSVCGFVSLREFERQSWAEQVLQEAVQEFSTLRGD